MTNIDHEQAKPFWKRPLGITLIIFVAILILGPIFSALGFGDNDVPETGKAQTQTAETEVPEASEPPTQEQSDPEDITEWVKSLRLDKAELITSATRDENDEIRVNTTIVDPRVEGPSPEGTDALALCIAIADEGEERVWIYEADGTTFVYTRDGICTEY